MEKSKAINLVGRWSVDELTQHGNLVYGVLDFIGFLYTNGFTIETKFQGEDLKKQEELLR